MIHVDNVYIPSSSSMFGVEVMSHPLVDFADTVSEFKVTQFQTKSQSDARLLSKVGVTFSLNQLLETVAPLPLLRFHAGTYAR